MKITSSLAALAVCTLATSAFATTYQSVNGYQITPPDKFVSCPNPSISYDSGPLHARNMAFDAFFSGPSGESINVIVKNAPSQLTLPMLLKYAPQFLESAMTTNDARFSSNSGSGFQGKTKLRFLSKGYTTVGGTKAITFLTRYEAVTPKNAILVRHVLVLRRGCIYTFACTAPSKNFWKMAPLSIAPCPQFAGRGNNSPKCSKIVSPKVAVGLLAF